MSRIYCQAVGVLMVCMLTTGCVPVNTSPAAPSPDISEQAGEQHSAGQGILPEIDGSIQAEEWKDAEVWNLEGGGQLYLLTAGDHLFLAVRALPPGMIVGNVFLSVGNEVKVFHSSAALGTVIFQQDGDNWQKIKDFEWCCRSRVDDPSSREARTALYDREGWLGANSFLGAENELEYKIRLEGSESALALNYLWADGSAAKQVWPAGLSDGVSWPSEGGFPDLMEFSPEKWYPLQAASSEIPPS
jgi:hypothetical protein